MLVAIDNAEQLQEVIKAVNDSSDLARLPFESFQKVYDYMEENDLVINPYNCENYFEWIDLFYTIEEFDDDEIDMIAQEVGVYDHLEPASHLREDIMNYCTRNESVECLQSMLDYKYDFIVYDNDNRQIFVRKW